LVIGHAYQGDTEHGAAQCGAALIDEVHLATAVGDRDGGWPAPAAQGAHKLEPVHLRHQDAGDNQFELAGGKIGQRLPAIAAGGDMAVAAGQEHRQVFAPGPVRIDQQNARLGRLAAAIPQVHGSGAAGQIDDLAHDAS